MVRYIDQRFDVAQGFKGLLVTESGSVFDGCAFDARSLGDKHAPFPAIQVPEGQFYRLTILNCVFYNFARAVYLPKMNGLYVCNTDFAYNACGIYAVNCGYGVVVAGCFDANDMGLYMEGCQAWRIGTHVERNGVDVVLTETSHDNIFTFASYKVVAQDRGQSNKINKQLFTGYMPKNAGPVAEP